VAGGNLGARPVTLAAALQSVLAPPAPAGPQARSGSLIMPPQQTGRSGDLPADTSYSLPFSPGFEESPVWPVEAWSLSSFQVSLSGTLTVPIELQLTPQNDTLEVTLGLVQQGHPVWSNNLSLKLVPRPGTNRQIFDFATNVFVDLVNPLRYVAGVQPQFVVSGIVPVLKPGPGYEAEVLAKLGEAVLALQEQGASLGQVIGVLQEQGATQEQVREVLETQQEALEGQGVTQEEMLVALREIVEELEEEP
jgi:hypothetical protein